MAGYYVIVASASRARFFNLRPREIPEMESGPNLVEEDKLENLEGELPDREVFSSPKSGRHRDPVGGSGAGHGYDDHRQEHRRELEKHFAEKAAEKAVSSAKQAGAEKLVLAAESRMLGLFRPMFKEMEKRGIELIEHDADLVNYSTEEIHRHLAKRQLLPEKKPPRR